MISDELLKELKQILLEDYKLDLTDAEVLAIALNFTGLFKLLISVTTNKETNLIINENKNDNKHVRGSI